MVRRSLLAAILAALVCMLHSTSPAYATTLADHLGNQNPATEGWTLYNSSGGTVYGGTEATVSGTYDYWRVSHPSTTTPSNYYRYILSPADLDADWYISGSIRVVDSRYHAWGYALPFGMFSVRDDYSTWGFLFGNSVVGIMDSTIHFSRSQSMDTRSDYHLYEMLFHRNGVGYADDTADFLIDGSVVFGNVTRAEVQDISNANGSLRGVYMGAGSSGAYTIMNFGSIALLDSVQAAIPEPATLSLLALGLIGLASRRKQR